MRISTNDYDGFKRIVASLGTPREVYYSSEPPGVSVGVCLAVYKPDSFYVAGDTQLTVTVTQFLLDFPGAIEAHGVQGTY